ncbi:MAG: hypothetical protein ISS93_01460 [Candidatus Aenigmarchaeota archaeon]|nr:hypothetical protein [Candidatus Aenigmarchaeota archaeon]
MANYVVLEYVEEQLEAGYSFDEIRSALLDEGWSDGEIDDAFSQAKPHKVSKLARIKPKSSRTIEAKKPQDIYHTEEKPDQVYPPVEIKSGKSSGFIISLIGGLLLFVFGLETMLKLEMFGPQLVQAGLAINLLGLLEPFLVGSIGAVIFVLAVIIIIGSFISRKEGKERLGAIIVLLLSIIAIVGFNSFLVFVGAALGIIGGILAFRKG